MSESVSYVSIAGGAGCAVVHQEEVANLSTNTTGGLMIRSGSGGMASGLVDYSSGEEDGSDGCFGLSPDSPSEEDLPILQLARSNGGAPPRRALGGAGGGTRGSAAGDGAHGRGSRERRAHDEARGGAHRLTRGNPASDAGNGLILTQVCDSYLA